MTAYDPTVHGKRGSYSKPIGKVQPTPELALADAGDRCSRSDRLVDRVSGGWQTWARRANARGVGFPMDYEFGPDGRRAKMRRAGEGRILVAE